jgi:hypothetical protein
MNQIKTYALNNKITRDEAEISQSFEVSAMEREMTAKY